MKVKPKEPPPPPPKGKKSVPKINKPKGKKCCTCCVCLKKCTKCLLCCWICKCCKKKKKDGKEKKDLKNGGKKNDLKNGGKKNDSKKDEKKNDSKKDKKKNDLKKDEKKNDSKKVGKKDSPQRCKKCCQECCKLVILCCWIIIIVTLGFGFYLLFYRLCSRFPYLTPYDSDRVIFYAVVTYMFWTSVSCLIFLISAVMCQRSGKCRSCLKNSWAVLHIVIGILLILAVANLGRSRRFRDVTLRRIVGNSPQNSKWLPYLQETEICCGIANSLDVPDAFVQSHCDTLFHSKRLMIGCGPILLSHVKGCQTVLLIFMGLGTTVGLLPFVICSKRLKEKQSVNAVAPTRSSPKRRSQGQAQIMSEGQPTQPNGNYNQPSMKLYKVPVSTFPDEPSSLTHSNSPGINFWSQRASTTYYGRSFNVGDESGV